LDEAGRTYAAVEVGAMIEVPAAAVMIDRFLRHFDFVSIGTNDLIQYTLAIDRADEAVAHLYDPWHPAVLQLLSQTIAAANRVGAVSACVAKWRATLPSRTCFSPWACAASPCTRREYRWSSAL
jgi:phosphotransferase system enzyme I (PtsI)